MRNKRGRKSIDMIPMIDVVFQLILFFLVSTTFAMLPGINLQLPESSTAKASAISDLFVIVINRNEVYLNNDKIPLDNLESALSVFSQSEMSNITLEADESVSYGLIIETLDILRKSGYQNINLHTIER
ncbi:MAG: biopolymer transporter ExbD [Treponema sp.]|nr:biopolymer transporter ExbD [Treponema sp.]